MLYFDSYKDKVEMINELHKMEKDNIRIREKAQSKVCSLIVKITFIYQDILQTIHSKTILR